MRLSSLGGSNAARIDILLGIVCLAGLSQAASNSTGMGSPTNNMTYAATNSTPASNTTMSMSWNCTDHLNSMTPTGSTLLPGYTMPSSPMPAQAASVTGSPPPAMPGNSTTPSSSWIPAVATGTASVKYASGILALGAMGAYLLQTFL